MINHFLEISLLFDREMVANAEKDAAAATQVALSLRLLDLSYPYNHRPYIARRGVLDTLTRFLEQENVEVRINAAKTLLLLSEHPENPELMCRESGLLQALRVAYESVQEDGVNAPVGNHDNEIQTAENKTPEVTLLHSLSQVVQNLENALEAKFESEESPYIEPCSAMVSKRPTARVSQSQLQDTRKLVLDIPSLMSSSTDTLADLLESVRGVISFTMNLDSHEVTLHLTTPTPTLLRLLEDRGHLAVVRSDFFVNAGQGDTRRESLPSYLPSRGHYGSSGRDMGSVVPYGDHSLAARRRRRRRRRTREAEEHSGGLLQRIASVFW